MVDEGKRRVISSVFQMEFAVIDNDPDIPVENGNTCYCSYKLECVFINYIASASKQLVYVIFESNSIAGLCNNHGVVSTRRLLNEI